MTEVKEDSDGNPIPPGRKFEITCIYYDNEAGKDDKLDDIAEAFKEIVNEYGAECFVTEVTAIKELSRDN